MKQIKIIWKEESKKEDSLGLVDKQGKKTQKIKITADKKLGVKAVKEKKKPCVKTKGEGLVGNTKSAVKEAREELKHRFKQTPLEDNKKTDIKESFLNKLSGLIDQVSSKKKTEAFEQVKNIINNTVSSKKKLDENSFDSVFVYEGIKYELSGEGNAMVGTHQDVSGEITIPEKVKQDGTEMTVTKIGFKAFEGCYNLTSITLPNTIIRIGDLAFDGCKKLKSISLPNSLTSIGDHAFFKCESLTSIKLPDSLETIEFAAFGYCSELTSVIFPSSIKTIKLCAFYHCKKLTNANVPASCSMGDNVFYDTPLENKSTKDQEVDESKLIRSSRKRCGIAGKGIPKLKM